MARLEVSSEEAAAWSPKISAIVDWLGQLRAADVAGVEPLLRAPGAEGAEAARVDEVVTFGEQEAMLGAAHRRQPPYLYIPRILNAEEP